MPQEGSPEGEKRWLCLSVMILWDTGKLTALRQADIWGKEVADPQDETGGYEFHQCSHGIGGRNPAPIEGGGFGPYPERGTIFTLVPPGQNLAPFGALHSL